LQFFINTQRAPTDDINVRRALLYAIDRQTIVNTLFKGYSPVAYGPLSANTFGFDPNLKTMYSFNPDKARELLDAAGWKALEPNGIRQKGGRPLRLDGILMTWGFLPEIGALLQAQLRAVGVDLQAQTLSYPAAVDAAQQGKPNLIPFNLSGTDPDILRDFFESKNAATGFNWSKVNDPELDRLLTQGAQTLDGQTRAQIYAHIQQRIMDQALIIPIRDYVNINAASAKVKDLRYDVRGWFPILYDVHLEP
jgi:peptide/nickel transport system substrate-binding protein